MSKTIERFLDYKENIARQYQPKIDWKEYYIKDCLIIMIDSIKKRDKLRKVYPAYWSMKEEGEWVEWESPHNFIEVGQIISISKDNELRYIFSSMDACYHEYSAKDKKEIYFFLTQIQKNML